MAPATICSSPQVTEASLNAKLTDQVGPVVPVQGQIKAPSQELASTSEMRRETGMKRALLISILVLTSSPPAFAQEDSSACGWYAITNCKPTYQEASAFANANRKRLCCQYQQSLIFEFRERIFLCGDWSSR